MVSDKSQVRSTGAINPLTRQPIKGRKKGGGIRLGEMERDALLAHGGAYLLRDRLMNCSDRSVAYVCTTCGEMLAPTAASAGVATAGHDAFDKQLAQAGAAESAGVRWYCRHPECTAAAVAKARTAAADKTRKASMGGSVGDEGVDGAGGDSAGSTSDETKVRSGRGVRPGGAAGAAAAAAEVSARAGADGVVAPAGTVVPVEVPYVYRFLLSELVGMNIKITLDVKDVNRVRAMYPNLATR